MKLRLSILFLFLTTVLFGQIDKKDFRRMVSSGEDYLKSLRQEVKEEEGRRLSRALFEDVWTQYDLAVERTKLLVEQGADFVIEPLYYVNLRPVMEIIGKGDWGKEYLTIEENYLDIKQRIEQSGRTVNVTTFDTGRPDHQDIQDYVDNSWGQNWTSSKDEWDRHSHSTHCMGIVGGADNDVRSPLADAGRLRNGWQKVLSDSGSGQYSWVANATLHQNKKSAEQIANGEFCIYVYSLGGGTTEYEPLEQAFKEARELGVLIITSAGNTGSYMTYPSTSPYVYGIGSLQRDGTTVRRSSFSSYGEKLWATTPGSYIYSTILNDDYAYKSGTSMAAPMMVQCLSIVASLNRDATADEVVAHFEEYMTDLPPTGRDDEYGYGWPVLDKIYTKDIKDTPPPPEEICDNGIDDDGDGFKDCADPDCIDFPGCEPEEICDNKIDDDGDGLVDCDDPDCEDFEDCREKDDPIDWPARMYEANYPQHKTKMYSIKWRAKGEEEMNTLDIRLVVEAESKTKMEDFAELMEATVDKHFRNRWYFLSEQSDFYDAAFWAAYFLDLIEGKNYDKFRVNEVFAVDRQGRSLILREDDLKDLYGLSRLFLKGKRQAKELNAHLFDN